VCVCVCENWSKFTEHAVTLFWNYEWNVHHFCYWLCNSALLTTKLYSINDRLKIAPSVNLIYVIHPMEVMKWHNVEFGGNWWIFLIIIFNSAIYHLFNTNAYFALLLGKPIKTVCSVITFEKAFPVADMFHMPLHMVRTQWGWLRLASNVVACTMNLLFYITTSCILRDYMHFL